MPKPKFNDFSRYKNNELRNHFFRRELDLYIKKKNRSTKYSNPLLASTFSAIIIISLWATKNHFENSGDGLVFSWHYVIIPFAAAGSYLVLYFMFQKLFQAISDKIEDRRFMTGVFDTDTGETDAEYLEKFNYEIVNQVSVALSLISHTEEDNVNDTERRFYTTEAFQYLQKAMRELCLNIIYSPFLDKLKNPEYTELRQYRVTEIVNVSEEILNKVKEVLEVNTISELQQADINAVQRYINSINKKLLE